MSPSGEAHSLDGSDHYLYLLISVRRKARLKEPTDSEKPERVSLRLPHWRNGESVSLLESAFHSSI